MAVFTGARIKFRKTDCAVGTEYHSQCADPDHDWEGVYNVCECT